MMEFSLEQLAPIVYREFLRQKFQYVIIFVCISLLALVLGAVWPKRYSAFSTIFFDEQNIIRPLMEGRASTTNVTDRVRLASELIFSQKNMQAVLTETGVIDKNTTPIERERIFNQIQKNTDISRVGNNLIKIEYFGEDPQKTYAIARRFTESFIEESQEAQRKESSQAYAFIDSQVKEYHQKLSDVEQKLKDFRSDNVDATPGSETQVSTRITTLQQRIEQAKLDLHEAIIRKTSLENQLSGEAEVSIALSKEGQYRNRIAELQSEMDTLRLNYHDSHPDIVRLKHQIEDLKEAITKEHQRREEFKKTAKSGEKNFVDDNVTASPLYQQLKSDLSKSKTEIATLEARITETEGLLKREIHLARQIHGVEAGLAELTRDYNVNKDIYQDLLRRRENARVSMNLGAEAQGPTLKIQEPARLPIQPSGLRYFHFMLAGILLAILVPIGIIYLIITVDPRIRSEAVLIEKLQIPVLASLPTIHSSAEIQKQQQEMKTIIYIMAGDLLIYVAVALLKIFRII